MTSRDIICMQHKRHNTGGCRGDGVPAARSVAFPQTRGPRYSFCVAGFSRVSKILVLIFLMEILSCLTE